MKKILEALKITAITTGIIITNIVVILELGALILDHIGVTAAYVFYGIVLFGAVFIGVWLALTDKRGR